LNFAVVGQARFTNSGTAISLRDEFSVIIFVPEFGIWLSASAKVDYLDCAF
jgi:hypothetical protein